MMLRKKNRIIFYSFLIINFITKNARQIINFQSRSKNNNIFSINSKSKSACHFSEL